MSKKFFNSPVKQDFRIITNSNFVLAALQLFEQKKGFCSIPNSSFVLTAFQLKKPPLRQKPFSNLLSNRIFSFLRTRNLYLHPFNSSLHEAPLHQRSFSNQTQISFLQHPKFKFCSCLSSTLHYINPHYIKEVIQLKLKK